MKYKWIELQNYAGIYNGIGETQIKIDFTLCKSNKIVIRGSNGSGKSTLMNAIDINPDSNDKFIPNAEARKNLCIIDNGIEYIIRYIHPITNSGRGTTKGYVSKMINGEFVELNPNGNISSCRDIIYEEFNLDANFMALSQLSSEDRGLVDKKPVERKKLLNGIINTLDTYNNIYKVLNKKSSIFKSTINSLTYKIDSIGDETTVQLNLKSIEARINDLESKKSTMIEAIAATKLKIAEYINILNENNYDETVSELSLLNKDIDSLEKIINKTLSDLNINDIEKVFDFLDYLNKKCLEMEIIIDNDKKQIPALLAQRESEYSELVTKQEKLNSLQSDYNYTDIKNAKNQAESKVAEYEAIFNQMKLSNINIITKEEFDTAMETLNYLKQSAFNITSLYSLDSISFVYNNIESIRKDMISLPNSKKKLDSLKEKKFECEKELTVYESMRTLAAELRNRPAECKIDTCAYIKSAIEADRNYTASDYEKLNSTLVSYEEEIRKYSEFIERTEEYSRIVMDIDNIQRELNSKIKFINKLPIAKDFAQTFMSRVINNDHFADIDELYKFIDCGNMIEEYKVAKENFDKFNNEYKLYESKNEIIESILEDINELTKKTDELAKNIDSINADIKDKETKLLSLKSARDRVDTLSKKIENEYKPSLEKRDKLQEIKNSLENNNVIIAELNNELMGYNATIASLEKEISTNKDERDELKHAASLLVEYKNELEIYSKKYDKINKIKYYSSPSTGIQTLFMELYMNKIIAIANDLLSLLFNGEFTLQPFIINDNEFRIPCVGSGLMHDDISSMSTAQKSMISMIISFSLLHQSSTKYNIIKVDEIDGGLDNHNRGYFINLLDQLMSLLKCEQCFIVSHNNELNTNLSDIIILKNDTNEVYNGNIIWQH